MADHTRFAFILVFIDLIRIVKDKIMKLRVPPGCGAASYAGRALDIDAEGCVYVEDHAARALRAHGFELLSEDEAEPQSEKPDPLSDDVDRLNRRGLFAFLKANGVGVSLPIANEELRALARKVAESAPRNPPDSETEGSR
jgi:hypothetical protein